MSMRVDKSTANGEPLGREGLLAVHVRCSGVAYKCDTVTANANISASRARVRAVNDASPTIGPEKKVEE